MSLPPAANALRRPAGAQRSGHFASRRGTAGDRSGCSRISLTRLGNLLILMAAAAAPGCAAFRPIRGVPASYMPTEFQAVSREDHRTINLGMLVRRPQEHRVAGGDILSVYIPGVLGRWVPNPEQSIGEEPPINLPLSPDDPPTVGYPLQVHDDDTISLPQIPPLNVAGMTLHEVEEAIRRAYTVDRQILRGDPARIMVSLFRPREYRVLVVRQESQGQAIPTMQANTVNLGSTRRGIAREVRLRAFENDVMHALSRADVASGLPGLDAENTLYIIRNRQGRRSCPPGQGLGRPGPGGIGGGGAGFGHSPVPGFMQIPAADLGGHSVVTADHNTTSRRQEILLTGHQPVGGHSISTPRVQPAQYTGPVITPQPTFAPRAGLPPQVPIQPMQQMQPIPQGYAPFPGGPNIPHEYTAPQQALPPQALPPVMMPGSAMPPGHAPPIGPTEEIGPFSPLPGGPMDGHTPIDAWQPDLSQIDLTIDSPDVIKIPIRIAPGETPHITEEDITLYDGDIIFIESRETEVFYTGGLLGGGQFTLPRDYDLNVLQAISIATGQRSGGGGSQALQSNGGPSALNQDVIVSASRLVILRKLPTGDTVPIEIDLYRAMKYPHENITVQAGDYLLLQYTCPEAIAAFCQRNLLEGALIGIAASTFTSGGGGGQ